MVLKPLRIFMTKKKVLAVVSLLSVALWSGCATGGSGHTGSQIHVTVNTNPSGQGFVGVNLTVQFTATVTGTTDTAVTWNVSGTNCTGTACGTISSNGLYTAPSTVPAEGLDLTVTATLTSNPTKTGTYSITVLPLTVLVTPKLLTGDPLSVVKGTKQQFTATVSPDAEPQTVTWSLLCGAGGNACGTVDANTGLFSAPNSIPGNPLGHVTATSTVDSNASATVDLNIVASRLAGNTTYAFYLTGYDTNGSIAVAGNFTTNSDGTAISPAQDGIEDDLTISQYSSPTITGISLALDSNNFGNSHGTLTINTSAGSRRYKVAFDADGDARMIEFDSTGRHASGQLNQTTSSKFKDGALASGSSFAFGLTGVTTTGTQRAGFAGVFQPDGVGHISSGMLDKNENGTVTPTAADLVGTYSIDDTSDPHPGRGTLTLTSNSLGKTYNYAIYVIGGLTTKATNPLTLFMISTDNPLSNPAVSGTIVFQDPTPSYVNSDFTSFWVANLTGITNSGQRLVSLTNGAGNGAGQWSGFYDANNAGTIVSAKDVTNYAYASTGGGRYTIDLLGDPKANPVVPPIHFVLYSSAANRGFLLSIDDKPATAVYTGTMDVQGGDLAPAELAGSMQASSGFSGSPSADQVLMNLLMTSAAPDFTLVGQQEQNDTTQAAGESLAGTYSVSLNGSGPLNLTQPPNTNYVIYVLDNPLLDKANKASSTIQHFVMIRTDSADTNPSVIFGER